jgi:hypothetical protein
MLNQSKRSYKSTNLPCIRETILKFRSGNAKIEQKDTIECGKDIAYCFFLT